MKLMSEIWNFEKKFTSNHNKNPKPQKNVCKRTYKTQRRTKQPTKHQRQHQLKWQYLHHHSKVPETSAACHIPSQVLTKTQILDGIRLRMPSCSVSTMKPYALAASAARGVSGEGSGLMCEHLFGFCGCGEVSVANEKCGRWEGRRWNRRRDDGNFQVETISVWQQRHTSEKEGTSRSQCQAPPISKFISMRCSLLSYIDYLISNERRKATYTNRTFIPELP